MVKFLRKPGAAVKPVLAKPKGELNPSSSNLLVAGRVATEAEGLQESTKLRVFDIPDTLIDDFEGNPNEQSEKTFDEIVERVRREGPDEPIIVVPTILKGVPNGRYTIVSGHHRRKAYRAAGLTMMPSVIRQGWDEDRIAIEVISRNALRGQVNPYKFTEMFDRLQKRYDKAQLQKMMGLTEKKQFAALYKRISDNLSPKQKRKLDEAKETVNSIEDLNAVLHTIFKEHGAELDYGFMVFNYGGQKHHYIKIDGGTSKQLEDIEAHFMDTDGSVGDTFKEMIAQTHAHVIRGNVAKPKKVLKRAST